MHQLIQSSSPRMTQETTLRKILFKNILFKNLPVYSETGRFLYFAWDYDRKEARFTLWEKTVGSLRNANPFIIPMREVTKANDIK